MMGGLYIVAALIACVVFATYLIQGMILLAAGLAVAIAVVGPWILWLLVLPFRPRLAMKTLREAIALSHGGKSK